MGHQLGTHLLGGHDGARRVAELGGGRQREQAGGQQAQDGENACESG
jgi:hypothetical protein